MCIPKILSVVTPSSPRMPLRQNSDKIDVRDIPQLNVCALMRARCVVNAVYATDSKSHREMSHGEVTKTTKSLNAFTPEGRVNTAFHCDSWGNAVFISKQMDDKFTLSNYSNF